MTQPHYKRAAIVLMIGEGMTNRAIAAELKCCKSVPARIRAEMGLPTRTNSTSLESKLMKNVRRTRDGHALWKGRRSKGGVPEIIHCGKSYSPARVAFELRSGRPPEGSVRPGCGVAGCVDGRHLEDAPERRRTRLNLRAVMGLPAPWSECAHGHDWEAHGRVEPGLTIYCGGCKMVADAERSR